MFGTLNVCNRNRMSLVDLYLTLWLTPRLTPLEQLSSINTWVDIRRDGVTVVLVVDLIVRWVADSITPPRLLHEPSWEMMQPDRLESTGFLQRPSENPLA